MFLARLHSSIERASSFRQREIDALSEACRVTVTGDPVADLLSASQGLVVVRRLQMSIVESTTVSLRNLAYGVASAPMARTNNEEDFV
jgi:hypothetical protein